MKNVKAMREEKMREKEQMKNTCILIINHLPKAKQVLTCSSRVDINCAHREKHSREENTGQKENQHQAELLSC